MLLKCKMCGGDMEYTQGSSVMECPYCGTNQTLPKVDDERLGMMHSRANHLRLLKEFDKAQMIYEEIIAENLKDAEAHWCALLCRYGIEYVEDPYSRERKPTMHRTQFDAITEDAHYLSAVEHADSVARELYEHEAQLIDRIRKRYLSIASKEEPFDVFICYKETGADGQRTKDSVYAQEIYNELTREGYKVFFARITLEDKLGEAYEPYIFAALGSAKVMLVVGTSAAHMQAEWVKNEWKRYLYLMKQDSKKKLIPVYRDMEAYDMPEEFVYMQAQDYGKIGALQDIVRGVEKIVGKKQAAQSVVQPVQQVVQQQGAGVESLMRRAQLFLEDGDWESADEYLDKVLDINPEYAPAYFGKVMAEYEVRKEKEFEESISVRDGQFELSADWEKAIRFSDTVQKKTYEGYLACVQQRREKKMELERRRKEEERIQRVLYDAQESLYVAKSVDECAKVKSLIGNINDSRAQKLMAKCDAKIEEIKLKEEENKRDTYDAALRLMQVASRHLDYYEIGHAFVSLGNYRDSKALAQECTQKAQELRRIEEERAEEERKAEEARREQKRIIDERNRQIAAAKAKKRNIVIMVCAALAVAAVAAYVFVLEPMMKYNNVDELIVAGQYEQANDNLVELAEKNYKDAAQRIGEPYYVQAEKLLSEAETYLVFGSYSELAEKNYNRAEKAFEMAGTYKNAKERIGEPAYLKAEMYLDAGWYENAADAFRMAGNYSDAEERVGQTYYEWAEMLISMSRYDEASAAFVKAGDYSDAAECVGKPYYIQAQNLFDEGEYVEAANMFARAGMYSDASERRDESIYRFAEELLAEDKYFEAINAFSNAGTYRDAESRMTETVEAWADIYIEEGKYDEASAVFGMLRNEHEFATRMGEPYCVQAERLMAEGKYEAANKAFIKASQFGVAGERIGEPYYVQAEKLLEEGLYEEASFAFINAGDYADAKERIGEPFYLQGIKLLEEERYEEASDLFKKAGEYGDAQERITEPYYIKAEKLLDQGLYDEADDAFRLAGSYKDAGERVGEGYYFAAEKLLEEGNYEAANEMFVKAGYFRNAKDRVGEPYYALAELLLGQEKYEAANEAFKKANGYEDADQRIGEPYYVWAEKYLKQEEYEQASDAFKKAGEYSDAKQRVGEPFYIAAVKQFEKKEYNQAMVLFRKAGGYQNANERAYESGYLEASRLLDEKRYDEAADAFAIVLMYKDSEMMIKECIYQKAQKIYDEARYIEALRIYQQIEDYKDVASFVETDEMMIRAARRIEFSTLGNIVEIGRYEQDANVDNGAEPIEWIVAYVDSEENTSVLVSKYAIEYMPMKEKAKTATWANSTLRKWLNQDFYKSSFDIEEKEWIKKVTIKNTMSYPSKKNAEDTEDWVFLLNMTEAGHYFESDEKRLCLPTEYIRKKAKRGVYTEQHVRWWTRTPGYYQENKKFSCISYDGEVKSADGAKTAVSSSDFVRPAITIDLQSICHIETSVDIEEY